MDESSKSEDSDTIWFMGQSISLPLFENRSRYPGDYFLPKPRKPEITIVIQHDNPDDIASAIVSSKVNNLVDDAAVNYMIYKQLEQIQATLAANWESFGVVVGKKGDIITPLSLLEVKLCDGNPEPKANRPMKMHSCTAKLAMYYIFAPITLDTTYEGQKKALAAKLTAAVPPGQKLRSVSHQDVATFYGRLKSNRNYLSMAAALDMFLERFPNHAECKMRVGTECTRHKNCHANLLIPHLGALMDVPDSSQLLDWIWSAGAANEAKKLLDPRNALDDPYSYSPYFHCMALGQESIASIKRNGNLQVFVHTVGTVLGNERSKNAKMLRDFSTLPMEGAFVVGAIKSVHRQHDAAASPETDIDDVIKKAGKCPSNLDPIAWHEYVRGTPGLWNAYMKKGARIVVGLTNFRPGTMGEVCVAEAKKILDGGSSLMFNPL